MHRSFHMFVKDLNLELIRLYIWICFLREQIQLLHRQKASKNADIIFKGQINFQNQIK